jgi:hypothetical protein
VNKTIITILLTASLTALLSSCLRQTKRTESCTSCSEHTSEITTRYSSIETNTDINNFDDEEAGYDGDAEIARIVREEANIARK